MDILSAILALLVTLSMATERVTEVIKGLPGLSSFLANTQPPGWKEEARKGLIQVIAIAVGSGFAYAARGAIASAFKLPPNLADSWGLWVLFGGLASGGSGMWNSALDLVRVAKQQREAVMQQAAKTQINP
jgi:hypothetical protein